MNIGEASHQSGVPPKTIRYYEDIGLIQPAARHANNYRDYDDMGIQTLQFLKRARSLGFSIEDCRDLLSLYQDRHRSSANVKAVAKRRVVDIDRKIAELEAMRSTLNRLIRECRGDKRPECPILDDLAG